MEAALSSSSCNFLFLMAIRSACCLVMSFMQLAELLVANENISFVSEFMTEMEPVGLWEQTKEALADEAVAFGFFSCFRRCCHRLHHRLPWGLHFHHYQICLSHHQ